MKIHSQSSTTGHGDFSNYPNTTRREAFDTEKQEIDTFLKNVRERKRMSLFSDPNVKFES